MFDQRVDDFEHELPFVKVNWSTEPSKGGYEWHETPLKTFWVLVLRVCAEIVCIRVRTPRDGYKHKNQRK